MNKIMYTRPDGGVSIVIPAPKQTLEKVLGPLTEAAYEAHVRARSIPLDAINPVEIPDAEIPADREFRDAWKQSGNKVDFDLPKAKNIQLTRIREARKTKFQDLDIEFSIATEENDTTKRNEVAQKRRALRNITEPLKALNPSSIDEIKNAFPAELRS